MLRFGFSLSMFRRFGQCTVVHEAHIHSHVGARKSLVVGFVFTVEARRHRFGMRSTVCGFAFSQRHEWAGSGSTRKVKRSRNCVLCWTFSSTSTSISAGRDRVTVVVVLLGPLLYETCMEPMLTRCCVAGSIWISTRGGSLCPITLWTDACLVAVGDAMKRLRSLCFFDSVEVDADMDVLCAWAGCKARSIMHAQPNRVIPVARETMRRNERSRRTPHCCFELLSAWA